MIWFPSTLPKGDSPWNPSRQGSGFFFWPPARASLLSGASSGRIPTLNTPSSTGFDPRKMTTAPSSPLNPGEFSASRGPSVPAWAFRGRVTDWLDQVYEEKYDHAYLCGNARMIFEAFPQLVDLGMDETCIHTETYF